MQLSGAIARNSGQSWYSGTKSNSVASSLSGRYSATIARYFFLPLTFAAHDAALGIGRMPRRWLGVGGGCHGLHPWSSCSRERELAPWRLHWSRLEQVTRPSKPHCPPVGATSFLFHYGIIVFPIFSIALSNHLY